MKIRYCVQDNDVGNDLGTLETFMLHVYCMYVVNVVNV